MDRTPAETSLRKKSELADCWDPGHQWAPRGFSAGFQLAFGGQPAGPATMDP